MIEAFRSILGEKSVLLDAYKLREAAACTFETHHEILAILYPKNTQQVSECLKIASRYETPVYPVSGGKNWGHGSKVPSCNKAILMDLSQMNRIVEFDEKLAYVTLEPGVTQQQLFDFLEEKKSSLMMGLNGASRFASVMGNALERGDTTGVYGDRCHAVCALEVVLPTGEILHTGFKRFEQAACAYLHKEGVGPDLTGLFFQSNLGIVTQMTLWLEPKPKYVGHAIFHIEHENELASVLDALQQLSLRCTSVDISLWNDFKVFSRLDQYPFEEANQKTPLPDFLRQKLRKKHRVKKWVGNIAFFSYNQMQFWAHRRLIKSFLNPCVHQLSFFKQSGLKGFTPAEFENLPLAYWRKKTPVPKDPHLDQDGCGLIWLSPLLPFEGSRVTPLLEWVEETILEYGFEPNLAVLASRPRTLKLLIGIVYDRDVKDEDHRAWACHQELMDELVRQGYMPYRLGISSMYLMSKGERSFQTVLRQIKQVVDPRGILAPGRYEGKLHPAFEKIINRDI